MNQVSIFNEFNREELDTIKKVYGQNLSDVEFRLFMDVSKKLGLDVRLKQIHAVKRGNAMTIQTGIDGFRLIAERTGKYAPGREPTFQYGEKGDLISATSYVKKQTADGTWHEIAASAHFSEYAQKTSAGKITHFWEKMPHGQLAKCAEALCLRKAFPGDLSGIYTNEEMSQADISSAISTIEIVEEKKIEYITEAQAEELSSLLCECDESYQKQLWNYLKTISIDSLDKLPLNIFDRLKNAATRKREENLSKKQNESELLTQAANDA